MFPKLALPAFKYRLKREEGKMWIFDPIRRKFVVLTPEEWVRQHFVHFLLVQGYPASSLSVEKMLTYNGLLKRTDIVSYDRALKPYLLVECKNVEIPISEGHLAQAAMYNYTLKAPFLALTNGMKTFVAKIDYETKNFEILQEFPVYQG